MLHCFAGGCGRKTAVVTRIRNSGSTHVWRHPLVATDRSPLSSIAHLNNRLEP